MISRLRFGPVAASILAGFLGAGVVDFVVTMARAPGPASPGALLALSLGIYGAVGLVAALVLGALVGGVQRAIPGGPTTLRDDAGRDHAVATGLLATAIGVGAMAVIAAAGQRVLVRPMQSDKLATIAAAGLVLLAAVPGAALSIAVLGPLGRWITPRLPRPRATGTTGALLLAGLAAGVLGVIAAFSRADWRVLDLSPFASLALAAVAGTAHGIFWYRTSAGKKLAPRVPAVALSCAVVLVVVIAFGAGARLSDASPAFRAIEQGALGLRLGLRVARAASDRDGDGFSAAFGGGDCDDHRADVYPGAEEVPGNGVDENCEGGDAPAVATDDAPVAGDDDGDDGDAAKPPGPAPKGPAAKTPDGAGTGKPGAPGAPFAGNILIITIDAFRGDRLGVAGYGRPAGKSLTPNLDALARRGAYFPHVWSQAPNTPRSFPSILTSQFPSRIKWDKPTVNYPLVLPSNHTFFEDLKASGLAPIGIFSHFYFTADRGISKSFKEWSNDGAGTIAESNKDSASPRIVPRVVARLRKAAGAHERFVLWTHLFEPHSSYMTHKEFPTSGAGGVPGLMEKYDYEIAFADLWVGKVLRALDELGLTEKTAVVVMADHGEAWGEHKVFFHGQDLFEEQLRIPLIIALPGGAHRVIEEPVAAMDVGPTLVELVGGRPSKTFRGRSLVPALDGEKLAPRPIFGELMPATAWPHHAVMMIDGGSRALFEKLRAQLLAFEEKRK